MAPDAVLLGVAQQACAKALLWQKALELLHQAGATDDSRNRVSRDDTCA